MINNIKQLFPIFTNNPALVYLDNAATTLKPLTVLEKMMEYYTRYGANIHRGIYGISEEATEKYEQSRRLLARFIGARDEEIIFCSGTTDGINKIVRMLEEDRKEGFSISRGDEIVVSQMEHHSNLVPWQQLCKRKGAILKFLPVINYQLSQESIKNLINSKTKILAVTQVSNVLGVVNPIKEIIKKAREINPEIVTVVDGAQAVAHVDVDVKDLACDFYVFSGHKMYGPTGVGVVYGRQELLERFLPAVFGGGMIKEVGWQDSIWASGPEKFEAGTPPIAEVIGLGEAVKFIKGIGVNNIHEQETDTIGYLISRLKEITGITIFSPSIGGSVNGLISFVIEGVHGHDIATVLDKNDIAVRSGHHCAQPLHELLGVMATTRVSLGVYNSHEDVDRFIEGIKSVIKIFNPKSN